MILRPLSLLIALALVLPAAALAATKNGITPLTPKSGATVSAGDAVTFKLRVRGKGDVFVHVCRSAKKDREGLICRDAAIAQARRSKGRLFLARVPHRDFPEYWLNSPSTYYWQAHRIHCTPGNTRDCSKEGPVVKFKVG